MRLSALVLASVALAASASHIAQPAAHKRHVQLVERASENGLPARAPDAAPSKRRLAKRCQRRTPQQSASSTSSSSTAAAAPTNNADAKPSSSSSSAAAKSSSSGGGGGSAVKGVSTPGSTTPNGKKAAIAGGDSYNFMKDHIGSWYDWSGAPSGHSGSPIPVPMLWGDGSQGSQDASRVAQFKAISQAPPYALAFEEPDCSTPGSANVDVDTGVKMWNELMVPLRNKGTLVASPAMCKQAAETWLSDFAGKIGGANWDITAIHINKNNMDGVKADLDHYWNKYQRPMWVTELACVNDDNQFTPCASDDEMTSFIYQVVPLLEADSRVHMYAFSDGEGLGNWKTTSGGKLTAAGQAYLNAISKY